MSRFIQPAVHREQHGGRYVHLADCMALAKIAELRDSLKGKLWTKSEIAARRFEPGSPQYKRMRGRLYETLHKRGIPRAGAVSTEDLIANCKDMIARGKLGLSLEKKLFALHRETAVRSERTLCDEMDWGLPGELKARDLKLYLDNWDKPEYAGHPDLDTLREIGVNVAFQPGWRARFGASRHGNSGKKRKRKRQPHVAHSPGGPHEGGGRQAFPPPGSATDAAAPENCAQKNAAEPVKSAIKKPRFGRRLRFSALALICSLAMSAAGYMAIDPDLRSYRTLASHGPKKALNILLAEARGQEQGNRSWYYIAHAYYLSGQYEPSKKLCLELISKSKNRTLLGDCYYLLGSIEALYGKQQQAIGYYREAKNYYDESDTLRNYIVDLAEAKVAEPHECLEILSNIEPSLDTLKNDIDISYFYRTKARALIDIGDFRQALDAAKKSADLSEGPVQVAGAYSNMGYIFAALGKINNAILYTDKAEFIYLKMNDERGGVYNRINRVLIYHRLGVPVDETIGEVRHYAFENKDAILLRYLDSAQDFINLEKI